MKKIVLAVGALIVAFLAFELVQYGTLSPCEILRIKTQKDNRFAASIPDDLVNYGLKLQHGELTPGRCVQILMKPAKAEK